MRGKLGLLLGVLVGCLVSSLAFAEASQVSHAISNVWSYLFSPINCVANWSVAVWTDTVQFVQCVVNNANVSRLIP